MTRFTTRLAPELFRRAKIRAATDGVTLQELIARALEEHLRRKGGRP